MHRATSNPSSFHRAQWMGSGPSWFRHNLAVCERSACWKDRSNSSFNFLASLAASAMPLSCNRVRPVGHCGGWQRAAISWSMAPRHRKSACLQTLISLSLLALFFDLLRLGDAATSLTIPGGPTKNILFVSFCRTRHNWR